MHLSIYENNDINKNNLSNVAKFLLFFLLNVYRRLETYTLKWLFGNLSVTFPFKLTSRIKNATYCIQSYIFKKK